MLRKTLFFLAAFRYPYFFALLIYLEAEARQGQDFLATMGSLEEKEKGELDTGPKKIGMGDEWMAAIKKFPKERHKLEEHAVAWYAKAWPEIDGIWKEKLRERFRKMFQLQAPLPATTAAPAGWKNSCPGAKVGQTSAAAHSGKGSLAVVCFDKMQPKKYWAIDTPTLVPIVGKTYEFSAWFLTDETDSVEDALIVPIFAPGRKLLDQPIVVFKKDSPWWQKVEKSFTVPAEAVGFEIHLYVESTRGTIFVDDVSLKLDGKELLKNGGFEER
jgi:hypothetical protein